MICGLLGRKLSHSYSPQIHAHLGEYSYSLFEREPEAVGDFLKGQEYDGINVTIPYKKAVLPYCDTLTDSAKRLGSVNTIVRQADGTLLGHNSDYFGFSSMLHRSGLSAAGKKALVLGSGGAAVTAVAVLEDHGARVVVISRNGENNYNNLERHRDAALIVNATPVGMYPNVGISPVDLSLFPHLEGVLDLIYNPARTRLLLDAQSMGLTTQNGLWMLVAQAKESAEFFTGHPLSDDIIAAIHEKLRTEMGNIILIGMPGCGKSTIGSMVAEKLGRKLVDSDEAITEKTGRTPAEIIQNDGEPSFRKVESEVLREIGMGSGLVIATGGGCVTREENYPSLHQNGTIFWIQRDLQCLPCENRPLSVRAGCQALYQARKPLYAGFCDHIIVNDTDPEAAAEKVIREVLHENTGD